MSKMSISTYGSVNKEAGWNSQEVKAEKEKITIEDVLRSAELKDGSKELVVIILPVFRQDCLPGPN